MQSSVFMSSDSESWNCKTKTEMTLRSEVVNEKTRIVKLTCDPTVGLVIIPDPFFPLAFMTFEPILFCPCG